MSTPPLDTTAKRLDYAITASHLSGAEIARRMGLTPPAISKWRRGHRLGPDSDECRKLGQILKVNPQWLAMLSDDMESGDAPPPIPAVQPRDGSWIAIPRLLRIAAGVAEYSPLDGKKTAFTDRRSLEKIVGPISETDPAKTVFAADVHGDSMAPAIADGDTLIVQRYFPPPRAARLPVVESGQVYVLNLSAAEDDTDGEAKASVKRLILSGGHELHILSDNTKYPPRTVDLRRVRLIQALILGRPVQLIRDL